LKDKKWILNMFSDIEVLNEERDIQIQQVKKDLIFSVSRRN